MNRLGDNPVADEAGDVLDRDIGVRRQRDGAVPQLARCDGRSTTSSKTTTLIPDRLWQLALKHTPTLTSPSG